MKEIVVHLWDRLKSSLWFLPVLFMLIACLLSFLSLHFDRSISNELVWKYDVLFIAGAEGARTILSVIASSTIALAGVSFSITIVALTLASNQFGPRVLRNFMKDRGTQFVLGTFIGAFLYCILVLKSVSDIEGSSFIPHLSVSLGIVISIFCLSVFIFFIHHVSTIIQADYVIQSISEDLNRSLDVLFPDRVGMAANVESVHDKELSFERVVSENGLGVFTDVKSKTVGYVQVIHGEKILELCSENDLILKVLVKPGDYISIGQSIIGVSSAEDLDEELVDSLGGQIATGRFRTHIQDAEFGINQLSEIAVRALSPGVNDPFTAISVVNRLGGVLRKLVQKDFPSGEREDSEGDLRILLKSHSFNGLLNSAFDQIIEYGRTSVSVMVHMLRVLNAAAIHCDDQDRQGFLRQKIDYILTACDSEWRNETDLRALAEIREELRSN